jgi:UDPglucose 6-dehydrogenase
VRVSIVGAGYVGLVTAACLADQGHDVVCVDLDQARVEQIESGVSPIYEPGLDELIARHAGCRLRATTVARDAVLESELSFIAVGTPLHDGRLDLGAVRAATTAVGDALAAKDDYHVVVVKSTVTPGTTTGAVQSILESRSKKSAGDAFGLAVNPEFLTEGQAVADFLAPDRIVLGAIDERSLDALDVLYAGFPPEIPRVRTNPATAEMIKYASNALLATMISFSNEIANLCAVIGGVDVVDVQRGVHLSRYLTPLTADGAPVQAPIVSFLEAGCGFGGSCLPKDVRALIAEGERLERPMRILRAVMETNDAQADEVLRLLEEELGSVRQKRVTVLGLAFKPDTDDVRESPAVPIVERLVERGAVVTIHDPIVTSVPSVLQRDGVELSSDLEAALRGADAIVLVTRWGVYEAIPDLISRLDRSLPLVDGRRMLDKDSIDRYAGIGM